jgi:hypothetical protein
MNFVKISFCLIFFVHRFNQIRCDFLDAANFLNTLLTKINPGIKNKKGLTALHAGVATNLNLELVKIFISLVSPECMKATRPDKGKSQWKKGTGRGRERREEEEERERY